MMEAGEKFHSPVWSSLRPAQALNSLLNQYTDHGTMVACEHKDGDRARLLMGSDAGENEGHPRLAVLCIHHPLQSLLTSSLMAFPHDPRVLLWIA